MIKSLGIIFILSSIFVQIGNKLKIPSMISMIICGILLGNQGFNLLSPEFLINSSEIRKIALIIILLRVGFSLKLTDFKTTGRQSLGLAFLPATFELMGVVILAPIFFNISHIESLLLGSVLSAVSPAVVMPRMLNLIDKKIGTNKKIPQIILAGASLDDIYILVLFSIFLELLQQGELNILSFLNIPISILSGILIGIIFGIFLYKIVFKNNSNTIKTSIKVIYLLGISFLLITLEDILANIISISGLLAIITMAMFISKKISATEKDELSKSIMNLWSGGEILLFTLVGAEVNLSYISSDAVKVAIFIIIVLSIRCIGVLLALLNSDLNKKERLFCIIAYLPKATVQAAIGSVPLSLGLDCGELILTIAVMSILITAPLGAIGIDQTFKILLEQEI